LQQLTFAGSTIGEPWWTVGEIVAAALQPHGYDVTVEHESASHRNIPWVMQGRAQLGVTTDRHLAAARDKKGLHAESSLDDLRALATISRPNWLALAVRRNLGLTSLHEVRQRQYPLRILAGGTERGEELDLVLRYHGFTLDDLLAWGGAHYRWSGRMEGPWVRQGLVDALLGNIYSGYTPHGRYWYEATVLMDLHFLDFEAGLIEQLVQEYGYQRGTIPHGLFPGLDRDIPSVSQQSMVIYARKDLPDDLAALVARSLDARSDLFKQARSPLYYERERVAVNDFLPLHPAAERYYRERGYPIQTPSG
jgi:uncharacterized protein